MLLPRLMHRSIQVLRNKALPRWSTCVLGNFSSDSSSTEKPPTFDKYKEFKDSDAEVILDVDEERARVRNFKETQENQPENEFAGKLERGLTGVFDIQVLVDLLKEHKAQDVFVAKIPPEIRYVDYMIVVTGRSKRHIIGLGETIRKNFKRRRHSHDIVPILEGEDSDWVAMDLGNIALHIMSSAAREMYELESLWGIGTTFDIKLNSPDSQLLELIKKHNISLDDLQPSQCAQ